MTKQPSEPADAHQPGGPDAVNSATPRRLLIGLIVLAVLAALALVWTSLNKSRETTEEQRESYERGIYSILHPALSAMATTDQLRQISTCVTERTFEKVSEESRRSIVSGRDIEPGEPDFQIMFQANYDCAYEVAQADPVP